VAQNGIESLYFVHKISANLIVKVRKIQEKIVVSSILKKKKSVISAIASLRVKKTTKKKTSL